MNYFRAWRLISSAILAASLVGTSPAQPPSSAPKLPEKDYGLNIDGTATMVGKWSCGGSAKVEVQPSRTAEPEPGPKAEPQTVMVTASVPAIECGDAKMNEHLRKALKMKDFPVISYRAKHYTLVDNGGAVQSSGDLTIAGVTKPVDLGAKLIALPDGETRVVGQMAVNMLDYNVRPPSLFFGVLKVDNTVLVRFDTVVRLPDEVRQSLFSDPRHFY
jgi:hypothetical protein